MSDHSVQELATTRSVAGLTLDDPSHRAREVAPGEFHRFGRYRIVERIGAGGMAVVYRAHDPELDRDVALKLVRSDVGKRRRRRATRLLREARALADLSHPNVVQVFDVGEVDDFVFMSMQLVRGPDLSQWLREERRPWTEIVGRFVAAGRGLQAAHERGLVHRDFKPANVLIDADGTTKVVDFGLVVADGRSVSIGVEGGSGDARVRGNDVTVGAVGTPVYMAPEQHVGEADPRVDQFAFCVSLYEALYGRRPFDGTTMDELRANKEDGLPRPEAARDVPSWLLPILRRGTAPSPHERYPSMAALLRDLERGGGRRRRRWWWLGGAACVVVVVVVVAALRSSEASQCSAADAPAAVWSKARRDQTRSAFLREQASFAPAAWTRVEAGLDQWVAAYRQVATALCRQRDRAEVAAEVLDLRFACLHGALRRLDPTLEMVALGDRTQRIRAVDAVASMVPVERCLELSADNPLDTARAAADPVSERLWSGLDRVEVGIQMGAIRTSREALHELDAATSAKPHSPERAQWLLLDSVLARGEGDATRARASGEEAAALATELGLDEISAEAAIGLLSTVKAGSAEHQRWDNAARVAIERLGGREDLEARRLMALASAQARVRDTAAALELAERAWKLGRVSALGRPALRMGMARTLVQLQLLAGESTRALELAYKTTQEAIDRYGEQHPEVALLRGSLAHALARTGRYEEAEQNFAEAIEVLVATEGPTHPMIPMARFNRGHTLLRLGRWDEARTAYQEATAAFDESDAGTDAVLSMLSEAHINELLGDLDVALERAVAARVRAEQNLGSDSPLVAGALSQEAMVLLRRGDLAAAEARLAAAAEVAAAKPLPPSLEIHRRAVRGKLALAQGRPAEAVIRLEEAVRLQADSHAEMMDRAQVEFHLARARYEAGQPEEALALARRTEKTFEELGPGGAAFLQEVRAWLEAH